MPMDGSAQNLVTCVPLQDPENSFYKDPTSGSGLVSTLSEHVARYVTRVAGVITFVQGRIVSSTSQIAVLTPPVVLKARTLWLESRPALASYARKLLPFLPVPQIDVPEEPDPVQIILADYGMLNREDQSKVAKNLALLWNNFLDVFGGVSGFRNASDVTRKVYIEKLEAAARRMEAVKGTDTAFHYVTVELMRQYVSYFQTGHTDQKAVSLAGLVAPLIDRGRRMTSEASIPVKAPSDKAA